MKTAVLTPYGPGNVSLVIVAVWCVVQGVPPLYLGIPSYFILKVDLRTSAYRWKQCMRLVAVWRDVSLFLHFAPYAREAISRVCCLSLSSMCAGGDCA